MVRFQLQVDRPCTNAWFHLSQSVTAHQRNGLCAESKPHSVVRPVSNHGWGQSHSEGSYLYLGCITRLRPLLLLQIYCWLSGCLLVYIPSRSGWLRWRCGLMIRWEVPIDLVVHITVVLFLYQFGFEVSPHSRLNRIASNLGSDLYAHAPNPTLELAVRTLLPHYIEVPNASPLL